MKVMVFGGSFNPPHLGHLLMAEQILTQSLPDAFAADNQQQGDIEQTPVTTFDQLWFLPVGKHDFGKDMVAAEHRLKMLEALVADLLLRQPQLQGRSRLETHELEQKVTSHTADSLDYLQAQHPDSQFAFLIGSDNLSKFHLWQDSQGRDFHYLLAHYPVYVYPRADYPFEPLYENMWPLRQLPTMNVSSTVLRQRLQAGQDYQQLLSPTVLSYIEAEKLYGRG